MSKPLRLAAMLLPMLVSGCDARITITPTSATHVGATEPSSAAAESPASSTRPAWVDAPAGLHGGVYETTVIVGPEASREACEAKLAAAVEAAAANYVSREFGPVPEDRIDLRFASLRSQVVGETWEEHVDTGDEQAVFLHARLRFDDQLRTKWRSLVDQWITTTRTLGLMQGFAVGLGVLLAVHLALRFAR